MVLNTAYFKRNARNVMRNDLQGSLLVTFFAGCLLTAVSVFSTLILNRLMEGMTNIALNLIATAQKNLQEESIAYANEMIRQMQTNLNSVGNLRWTLLGTSLVMALIFTPALKLSEANYYINRLRGEEPGVMSGLFSRFSIFGKALCMYVLMFLKLFAWGLIYVPVVALMAVTGFGMTGIGPMLAIAALIPMFIAYLRYCMCGYFLAEHPEYGPMQAINESKKLMNGKKTAYFSLMFSFIGWLLLLTIVQNLLTGMGLPYWLVMVVALFGELLISVYMTASSASFYDVMTNPEKIERMTHEWEEIMRKMSMGEEETLDEDQPEKQDPQDKPADDSDNDDEILN